MKKHFIRLCLLATVLALAVGNAADAQTNKPRTTKKRTVASKKKNVSKNKAGADAVVAPRKDTVAKPVVVLEADIKIGYSAQIPQK